MKRGSNLCWRTAVGVGVNPCWRTTTGMSQHPIVDSRAGWPCSVGIRSARVEAVKGAADRTTWTAVVGLADETSDAVGSAVYPSCARLGASRPPQHVQVETICRRVGWPSRPSGEQIRRSENLGERSRWKEFTGGQIYLGAKVRGR